MSLFMNGQEYAPYNTEFIETPNLDGLEIFTGNYLDTSAYTVTDGVVDKYTRELVS